jgi:hypothetical protein
VYRKAIGSIRQNAPLFVHLDFFQSLHQTFILPSYIEASTFALANVCFIPPSPKLRTHYHLGVEIFIDDEAKEASVKDVFGLFLPLIILRLYLME